MNDESMFFGAKPHIFETARTLRNNRTTPEKLLWERLKNNQLNGFKFRKQHPIYKYVVDFYCHQKKLVIEIDGDSHKCLYQADYDASRTEELEQFGLSVLRFENREIETNIDGVVSKIENSLK